ncbi:MAG: hypothetical protein Q8M94_12290 [Ignavibacteria bacterium]|nr:hypothetical protein [Ignavibacteria bacterium]
MKTIILIIIAAIVAIVSFSCEENFSPKSDYVEKYILYCIINTDSTIQTSVLQRSYNVEGYDPYLNTIDPSIKGADIRIRQGNNVFFMRDTSIIRSDTSRYKTPINFYYTDNFFIQGNDSLEIIATLPNGKKLSGITNLTVGIEFDTASDHIIPSQENDFFSFIWNGEGSYRWYLPKFTFYYLKNGVRFGKDVPSEYIFESGSWIASYPEITKSNIIRFNNAALDSAFAQISSGDPDKSSYRILGGVLTLLVFNESLSNYYSTTNGFLDDFTIRLDEADYTNITG